MKKVGSNKNSFLCCIYQAKTEIRSKSNPTKDECPENYQSKLKKSTLTKILENWSYYKFNFIHNTKFKYVIFSIFLIYSAFNIFVCAFSLKIDIPITALLPKESYLADHMQNHLADFELGPPIMLNFMESINITDSHKFNKIQEFVKDIKKIDGVSQFELSWLTNYEQEKTLYTSFMSDEMDLTYTCLKSISERENYQDDFFIYYPEDKSRWMDIKIKRNRIYVLLDKFTGSTKELYIMHQIKDLADYKYNFSRDDLIVFSSVYIFLEQLNEIFPSIFALITITAEAIFFGSLFLFFDLKSILIKLSVVVSLILSIFSNLYIFQISLNIVTLYHMIMLPAILIELMFYTTHLFLFKTSNTRNQASAEEDDKSKDSSSSSTTNSFENENSCLNNEIIATEINTKSITNYEISHGDKEVRFKRLQLVLNKNVNLSSLYLLFISFSFGFMGFCKTYNFHTLYLVLLITCLNTCVHVYFFYPNLLNLFGTCWINKKRSYSSINLNSN